VLDAAGCQCTAQLTKGVNTLCQPTQLHTPTPLQSSAILHEAPWLHTVFGVLRSRAVSEAAALLAATGTACA
jgi:hypothetical protein